MKKEKYLQVFRYLNEFSKLRSKPVRDIENQKTQYPEVIWLDEIPDFDLFENILRPEFDTDNEYWLKIKKPNEPSIPKFSTLPTDLLEWIEEDTLLDEEDFPSIKEWIERDGKKRLIQDYPDIKTRLQQYLETQWPSDLKVYNEKCEIFKNDYNKFEKHNETYTKFFQIHNKYEQFGEEYELVIGVGLLHFQLNKDSPKIFRHIATQEVGISFGENNNDFSILIQPNYEKSIKVETDSIIDLEEIFHIQNIIFAGENLEKYIVGKEISSFFLDFEKELEVFANSISHDGRYITNNAKPSQTPDKPTISFSPALILRKRNTQSFTQVYENIIRHLETTPEDLNIGSLNKLAGIEEPHSVSSQELKRTDFIEEPVFFPKEFNDEQIEIVNKTKRNNSVLVQGPPGTGKSHTIANLICHLLAGGNKVLVTAYTKRALEVLQDKLPEQFQSLVISLLSGDSSSIQDLQRCINSINQELSRASTSDYRREIEKDLKSLSKIKEEIAEKRNTLVDVRESATRSHIFNEMYSGSLLEIARLLEEKETDLAWYKDDFCEGSNSSVIQKLADFHREFVHFKEATERHFEFSIPYSEKLISHPELEEYADLLKIEKEESSSTEVAGFSITSSDFPLLKAYIEEMLRLYSEWNKLRNENSKILFNQLETGRIKEIQESISLSESLLRNLEQTDLRIFDGDTEIQYSVDKPLNRLKYDGTELLKYLKKGKPLSGFLFNIKKPFLDKSIKEKLYFTEEVLVNGSPCDSIEAFELVLKDIAIRQDLKELSEIWELELMKEKKHFPNFSKLKDLIDTARKLVCLYSEAQRIRQKIEAISNFKVDLFNPIGLETAQREIRLKFLKDDINNLKKKLDSSIRHLEDEVTHPIREELLATLSKIDVDRFQQLSEELSQIREAKEAHTRFCEKRDQIFRILPNSVQGIENEEISTMQVEMIREAFFHRDAKRQIEELKDADFELKLASKLDELEKQEKQTIARLSSKKAWLALISNLNENSSLQSDLVAWALAVQKIGKGKGKRAGDFRKLAQENMKKAKDAVPCWIMPLYKVAETIVPIRGMYDYVIIDEASQLGPDSLFLLYISKKIIIVGDDKQTSPEYVGLEANLMTPHINRYLKGILRAEYFGMEYSLFDLARLFCGGDTVVLREHFRCMPEIIEFSNKHFYEPEGKALYPLKQYSENRLDPLVPVYCNKGYTDGSHSNIVNPPEAEEVANAVAEIVKNPDYKGKTIGIITLQGNSQAAKIENLILKRIDYEEYNKRKIICGNSTSFQGDERDIILLSLVTAPDHNRAPLVSAPDERRFNVAASRAKEQLWLFHSVKLDDLTNQNDLRYKLLHHFLHNSPSQTILAEPIERSMGSQPAPFQSWFEVDVYNDLIKRKIKVIPDYEVAKGRYRIDLVTILADGTKIAIECDGDKWHGPEQYWNDISRQNKLERLGWQFFRIRGHEYYSNRERALEPLWKLIEKQRSQASREETKKSGSQEIIIEKEDLVESFPIPEDAEEKREFDDPITIPKKTVPEIQLPIFSDEYKKQDKIIRYFNLFRDAKFRITVNAPISDADFVVPVYEHQRNGFILQCYDSGYVNKVSISALLAKKIDKEYSRGLNTAARLIHIEATDSERILGIYFTENRERKFKAHLTDKMNKRDGFDLEGYKVMYNDFKNIEFKLIPLKYQQDLDRLIFTSFTAIGKPLSNKYYEAEWTVLSRIKNAKPAPEF